MPRTNSHPADLCGGSLGGLFPGQTASTAGFDAQRLAFDSNTMSQHTNEGLTFLLPVCNQSGHLEQVLASWSTLLEKLERRYEILLIDDGSTDATHKVM